MVEKEESFVFGVWPSIVQDELQWARHTYTADREEIGATW